MWPLRMVSNLILYITTHKSFLVMPQVLRAADPPIPFDCIKQEVGKYMS